MSGLIVRVRKWLTAGGWRIKTAIQTVFETNRQGLYGSWPEGLGMDEAKTGTKIRILDVAEQLFAEHGADKATLRKICSVAGVNLAAVNYHFGSKAELINALLSRIMGPVVEAQLALLDQVERNAQNTPPLLEDVIRTFLVPIFSMARINPNVRDLFDNLSKAYGDVTRFRVRVTAMLERVHYRYIETFARILPQLPRNRLLYRYTLLWAATNDIVDQWIRENLQATFAEDLGLSDTFLEDMVRFVSAGFRAA
jgi:AcrR family transcriptional regulator